MSTISVQYISEPEALTAVTQLLLTEPGERHAKRAFLLDGRLYRVTAERVTNGSDMRAAVHREAGLPSPPDDPYAIDPADMREALQAAMGDPDLGAEVADRLALFTESNGYPERTAHAVAALREVMRWYREQKEAS